ncbi:MAG: haloalkane dehalogenase [Ilumatobacter sp.]|jgi:haloalkane dehalogenase|uniref:haloalkane dehalogenase n=1 Tax=Ilumatobacter sp. TaxID=1967498 RepID=UPI00391BCBD7
MLTTAAGERFVRTPDERFESLVDFPYAPRYVEVDGFRVAYIDEGPPDAHPIVLLHGEPAWSYLYRRMLPPLLAAGFRCIAPDLIGFGRSDKPVDRASYTYDRHVAWLQEFLDTIDLDDGASLFAQDWGGLLGLRVVAERPGRFEYVAVGNTALPTGASAGPGFDAWLAFSQSDAFDDVGALFGRAVVARSLTGDEIRGYDAPFPDRTYLAGAIAFPALVPITPAHESVEANRAAWAALEARRAPFLTLWCPDDPVLGHLAEEFIDRIPGAADQPHRSLRPGGHFVQDDRGEDIAAALIEWLPPSAGAVTSGGRVPDDDADQRA